MIITPSTLNAQIHSKILTMLRKSKEDVINLENPVELTSWHVIQYYMEHENINLYEKNVPVFDTIKFKREKGSASIYARLSNDSHTNGFPLEMLNIEDAYSLYMSLSSILTTVTPCYDEAVDDHQV